MKTMRCHTAFTLIEMIVATIAATLLIAGVLLMTSTLGRDRARLTLSQSTSSRSH
jgi:type II secretory pathway pseudopilin PulG